MGKKRRSRSSATTDTGPAGDPSATHSAINSWEDVADSADEFHLERDKVALESVADLNRRRNRRKDDIDDDEEEVMGLEKYGFRESESEDEEDEDEEEEEEEEGQDSDGADDSDSDDEGRKEEEVVEGWGSSKQNYYGGHDSDLEADPAEEEAEARRLQSTHLAAMADEDFVFDDAEWGAAGDEDAKAEAADKSAAGKVIEALPTVLPTDPAARLKLLHSLHPEFAPLSQEFLSLQSAFPALETAARASTNPKNDPLVKKWKIASTYLGVLSLYFALMAGEERETVREHPVMEALVQCRKRWEGVKDMRVERIEERIMPTPPGSVEKQLLRESGHLKTPVSSKKRKPSEFSDDEELHEPTPIAKKKSKTKTSTSTAAADFSDLNALLTSTTISKKKAISQKAAAKDADNDFVEPTSLSAAEHATKESRRKNLRFHTSQIVSRSNKRANAGINAGGDLDLPHRERRRERELRLQAEASRRRNEGADLDSRSPSPEPQQQKSRFDQAVDAQEAAYLALLSGGAKEAKTKKEQQYKDAKAGIITDTDAIDPATGKRAITYQIQKNKGLTPHRKKEVRNPRVKKRNAYEKKKKKLSSTKAVWKGGLQGSYGGEATGIKKGLVKSVKFNS